MITLTILYVCPLPLTHTLVLVITLTIILVFTIKNEIEKAGGGRERVVVLGDTCSVCDEIGHDNNACVHTTDI